MWLIFGVFFGPPCPSDTLVNVNCQPSHIKIRSIFFSNGLHFLHTTMLFLFHRKCQCHLTHSHAYSKLYCCMCEYILKVKMSNVRSLQKPTFVACWEYRRSLKNGKQVRQYIKYSKPHNLGPTVAVLPPDQVGSSSDLALSQKMGPGSYF